MRRIVVFVAPLLVALLTACFPQPAPDDYPVFPGVPSLDPYSGSQCKRVLLVGDSLMGGTGQTVLSRLSGSGRCAEVYNEAIGSTGPAGPYWPERLSELLDAYGPDIVVAEFIGNSTIPGVAPNTPEFHEQQRDATLSMIDTALARGVSVYWSIPPACCPDVQPPSPSWAEYRRWVRDDLGGLRSVPRPDWGVLTPTDVYAEYLRFPDGVHQVRAGDCIHLNDVGSSIAADVMASAIQGEWA